jgi:hypothetical protein
MVAFATPVVEEASPVEAETPEIAFATPVIAPVCPEIEVVRIEIQTVVTLGVASVFPMHFFHLPKDQMMVLFHRYLLRRPEPTTFRFVRIQT